MANASNVLLYAGRGASESYVKDTIATFQRLLLSENYAVRGVYAAELAKDTWFSSTSILVIPGGRASPYAQDLDGQANSNIIQYVKSGGNYIGLGAGSYYASQRTEFEKGNPKLEIIRDLPLKFYPGVCRGTVFPGFQYGSEDGSQSPRIVVEDSGLEYPVYYNGGGAFIGADGYSNVKVLGRYKNVSDPELNPAVIKVQVGLGRALLSGVHFEYIPTISNPDIYHQLVPYRRAIDKLVGTWLNDMGLSVKHEVQTHHRKACKAK